jgi:ABC-2 type transport system ATP-binding protein
MTVREYLTFVARIKLGQATKAERAARVDAAMRKTHVDDVGGKHCAKLSKGYRQRVGIAQAVLHDPEVLVLDEPTAGLDPKQIMEARELIRSLAGSHTIILSTHILPEVEQTCQRVVIINKGRVVAVDTPDNLTHQLKGASTLYVQIEGDAAAAAALGAIPGVREVREADRHQRFAGYEIEADHDVRRDVARTVVNKGWGLLELRPKRLGLEEIFIQLTQDAAKDEAGPDAAGPASSASASDAPPPANSAAPASEEVPHG